MKQLPQITVVCADCKNYGDAVSAIRETLKHIIPARTIFFTDAPLIFHDFEVVNIPRLTSTRDYSGFIMKKMHAYIQTPYILIIQADGFVLNADMWDDEFLKYDYIGAPWIFDHERQVGNGGFSLRSTLLHEIIANDDLIDVLHPEDQSICILYKFYLEEKHGIKFAPVELAEKFSFELREPVGPTFGFHSTHHEPFQEHVVIGRRDAMGDVIAVEPILRYYYEKGYKVILDTLPQFKNLFTLHDFPVYFPEQINPKIKRREINLNMVYEVMPQQNHLKSFYQACGIPEEEQVMRNPQLAGRFNPKQNKLFDKYVVIHIDKRQPGRTIQGMEWEELAWLLKAEGYKVIQIGRGEHYEIKQAMFMNIPDNHMLLWMIGGADFFIGVDSGPSNVAVAMNTPAVIFTGSVDLRLIIPDLTNVLWIHNHDNKPCGKPFCWHHEQGTQGVKCYVNEQEPPCVQFDTHTVASKIFDFMEQQKRRYADTNVS